MFDLQINVLKKINLNKPIIKSHYLIITKLKTLYFCCNDFNNFIGVLHFIKKKNIIIKSNKFKLNHGISINLNQSQLKIVLLNFLLKKKFNYSVGLILKILNVYKKSEKKSKLGIKYLISYLFQKKLLNHANILIIKGLKKNFIKFLYFIKFLINSISLNYFVIKPIKAFNKEFNIRIKRSIKRRIYKKLVDINNI